jgi:anaerobic magnesium-protoporphyrin IX monomethyl ester cyclase
LIDAVASQLDDQKIKSLIKKEKPALVVVETSTPSIKNDLAFCQKIKTVMPPSFIVLVGPHVSALDKEALKDNPQVDAVVRGEYELTLVELAQTLEKKKSLRKVKGLTYRSGKRIFRNPDRQPLQNLDQLLFVSQVYKKFLNPKNYFFAAAFYPMVQIFTGRGCPFHCFYCLYPQVMHGHQYRTRSIQNIVEEFEFIQKEMPEIKEVVIEDDTFTANIPRVKKFCQALIKKSNQLQWDVNARVGLDLKTMKLMKKAGCRLIIIGFESGNQKSLDKIQKGTNLAAAQKLVADAKKAGLLIHGCLMYGLPGENKQTMEKSFAFACKLNVDSMQFYPLFVYPGTKAYNWALKEKLLTTDNFRKWLTSSGAHQGVVNLPNLTSQEINQFAASSYWRYHFRPQFLLRKIVGAFQNPSEAYRELKVISKYLWGQLK